MATALPLRPKASAHTRNRSRAGMPFALPTALVVGVFFAVPLGLLVWMSFNDWPLIGERRGDSSHWSTRIRTSCLRAA
ncbi:sugar ABC transporter permease [Streptomyces rubrogriseus]|uniref:Sugar ABC transporter permease n=1 Tax=Streptomyces rubrogriseus TaxID=194673 RepID=A0A6G3TRR6_9ACTN|nr:sugar ABC transporter permease [Streptomyces rubrogriseus]NEC38988.1 sugar ABC transporter permease [Streptomyces rubrogriseus]